MNRPLHLGMRSGCQPGCPPGTSHALVLGRGAQRRGSVNARSLLLSPRRRTGRSAPPTESSRPSRPVLRPYSPIHLRNRPLFPVDWTVSPAVTIPIRRAESAVAFRFAAPRVIRLDRRLAGHRPRRCLRRANPGPRLRASAPPSALRFITLTRRTSGADTRSISIMQICPGGQAPDRPRSASSGGVKFSVSSPRRKTSTTLRGRPRLHDL